MTIDLETARRIASVGRWMLGPELPDIERLFDVADAVRGFDLDGDDWCREIERVAQVART